MRKLLIPALLLALSAPARATVPTTSTVAGPFTCNGATAFPVTFRVLDATHLLVERTAADGTVTPLARGVDYSVALSSTGATVTLTSSSRCSTGYTLTITRQVPLTQPTTLSAQGPFNPKVLEAGLDRVTSIAQELSREDGKVRDDFNALQAWIAWLSSGSSAAIPKVWTMLGDGAAAAFALTGNDIADPRAYMVNIDGVTQAPTDDYSVSATTHLITFTSPPPYGALVSVRCLTYARAQSITDAATVPVYADNAAAVAGGLTVGTVYRTSTGQLMTRY